MVVRKYRKTSWKTQKAKKELRNTGVHRMGMSSIIKSFLFIALIILCMGCRGGDSQNKSEKFLFNKYLLENFHTHALLIYKGRYHDTIKEYYIDKSRFQARILKISSPGLFTSPKYKNSFIDSFISDKIVFDLDTNTYIFCGTELLLDSTSGKIFNFSEEEVLKYYFEDNFLKLNHPKDKKVVLTEGLNGELTRGEHDALIKFFNERNYFVDIFEGNFVVTKFDLEKHKIQK